MNKIPTTESQARRRRDPVSLLSVGVILSFVLLAAFPPNLHPLLGSLFAAGLDVLLILLVLTVPDLSAWKSLRSRFFAIPVLAVLLTFLVVVFRAPYLWLAIESFNLLFIAFLLYLVGPALLADGRWRLALCGLAAVAACIGFYAFQEWGHGADELIAFYKQRPEGISLREYNDILDSLSQGRALAIYGNPNHLASVLAMLLPILWVCFSLASGRMMRTSVVVLALPSILAILATYSRAGVLMAIGVLVCSIWLWRISKLAAISESQILIRRRVRLGILLLIGFGVLGVGLLLCKKSLMGGRMFDVLTLKARGEFFLAAWKMILLHPWLGNGPGAYSILYPQFRLLGGVESKFSHNLFLQAWVEGGAPHLASWLVLVALFTWVTVKRFCALPKTDWDFWQLALAAGGALFLLHSQMDFVNDLLFPLCFFFLALSQLELSAPLSTRGDSFLTTLNKGGKTLPPPLIRGAGGISSQPTIRAQITALSCFLLLAMHWIFLVYRPSVAQGDYETGLLFVKAGKPSEAIEFYDRAQRYNPFHSTYREHLALTYLRLGNPEPALQEAQQAVALDPLTPHLRETLGNIYATKGRNTEAEREYLEAIRLHPNKPDYHLDLADLYRKTGRTQEAELESQRAREVDKGHSGAWTVQTPPSSQR